MWKISCYGDSLHRRCFPRQKKMTEHVVRFCYLNVEEIKWKRCREITWYWPESREFFLRVVFLKLCGDAKLRCLMSIGFPQVSRWTKMQKTKRLVEVVFTQGFWLMDELQIKLNKKLNPKKNDLNNFPPNFFNVFFVSLRVVGERKTGIRPATRPIPSNASWQGLIRLSASSGSAVVW